MVKKKRKPAKRAKPKKKKTRKKSKPRKKKGKKPKKRSKPRKKKTVAEKEETREEWRERKRQQWETYREQRDAPKPAKKKRGKKPLTRADVRRSERVYVKATDEYHRAGERVKAVHQAELGTTNHWS